MSGVVKKKSLLTKIIEKIKCILFPSEQRCSNPVISLFDIHTDDDESNIIASRREELRTAKHGNTDAVVIFNDGDYPEDGLI